MKDTRHRSYRAIIWCITQYCLTHTYGGKNFGSIRGFNRDDPDNPAKIGDLVIPTAAPISEWNISWLNEIKPQKYGNVYVLESIETGKLCNWSNIGIDFLNRSVVDDHPEWRWTDKQFQFNDRWRRVCFKEHDAYIILPLDAKFGPGFRVELRTRTRFGFDDYKPVKTFPDWRKVTKKMMSDLYVEFTENKPEKISA